MSDRIEEEHGEPDVFGGHSVVRSKGSLAEKFVLPPFTVLSAREGWWQSRKDAWKRLGIRSEIGRGGNLLQLSEEAEQYRRGEGEYERVSAEEQRRRQKAATPGGGGGPNSKYDRGPRHTASLKGGLTFGLTMDPYKDQREAKKRVQGPSQPGLVHHLTCGAYTHRGEEIEDGSDCGTSIFDPVLCELAYRWFCPAGGQVIDPFAGGSVRGIVAAVLGRRYWGSDLAGDQIAANIVQGEEICPGDDLRWVVGDSGETLAAAPPADFIFSCPPYYDLEVYSKDPRDLSCMDWPQFRDSYADIIDRACTRLRDDRFACFVVGDVRGPDGCYRDLPGLTTRCFHKAGLELYNEAVLVTAVGSLSIRAERQWVMSRKMGKTHQNVLVFVKGDPRLATSAVTGMSEQERREMLEKQARDREDATKGWER